MTSGYTKLFSSIVTSTIWVESDRTRIVWITMLAIADKNGEVQASIPGLARLAGVPIEDCEEAIKKFLAPDPYSRTPDDEGRRIEQIEGGWALLNHAKYRQMASKEDAKRDAMERQRRHRDKMKRNGNVTDCHTQSQSVTQSRDIAEAEAEAEYKTPLSPKPQAAPSLELEAEKSKPALSAEQIEVASWLNRRPTTAWSAKELKAWKRIPKPIDPEDWQALKWFYKRSGCKYLRRDLFTLLNNWSGEIDRAKNYDPNEK